jgi:hypothetical protein
VSFIRDGFFKEHYTIFRLKIPKRILVPFLILLAAKVAGALFIYSLLNIGSSGTFWTDPTRILSLDQNKVLLENANGTSNWAYTFVGWDSAWYLSIMTRGYGFSPQSYAFSPILPFLGRVFNLLFQSPVVSITVCSLVFGVLWIPFYQLVAEKYMSKQAALGSALIFALSPYVFLFTTLVYSEGLFLFFTLSGWHFFKKGKITSATWLAAVSALTRIVGVVLVLPMLIVSLLKKGARKIYWVTFSLLPIVALLSWLAYCQLTANDFLAFMHATEWSSLYTLRTLIFEGLPQKGFNVFQEAFQNTSAPLVWFTPFAAVVALVIPPFLIYKTAKTEKSLAIYSLVCYVWFLMFGALVSMPRYVSVLYPLWIPLTAKLSMNKKSAVLLGVTLVVSFIISLSLWVDFLNGMFVA